MKSSTRRQVKTPVGHKTKRGAELESTPKTPRSFEPSPAKSACTIDGEPDDQKLSVRTKRPLQWGSIPKQRVEMDTRGENTMSPSAQAQMKFNGDSKPVAALSPICVNAINGNAEQHGAEHKVCLKNVKVLPSAVQSPSTKASPDRRCLGKAKALHWSSQVRDETGEVSADEGSCLSPSHISSNGKQVLFWSNAAFSTHEPGQNEDFRLMKNTPCSISCASSASSSQNTGSILLADSEAESKRLECMNVCSPVMLQSGDGDEHVEDSLKVDLHHIEKEDHLPERTGRADVSESVNALPSRSELNAEEAEIGKRERSGACKIDVSDMVISTPEEASLLQILKSGTSCYTTSIPRFGSSATKQNQEELKCNWEAGNDEESLKDGLNKIQQEIERLTERLAELHLQKRKREEEIQQQMKARKKDLVGSLVMGESSVEVEKARQAGVGASVKTKEADGGSFSRRSLLVPQRSYGRDETPLASYGRHVKGSAAISASKLSEMRRSASCSGRRMEKSSREERMKALRRLSLSGAATAESAEMKAQKVQPQAMAKGAPVPSRVVSSRFGRALTPDACRHRIPAKKHDGDRPRPSASASSSPLPAQSQPTTLPSMSIHCSPCKRAPASSSPLPAQPQPTPSPSTSIHCSPLRGVPTVRSGYPSRSGLSTPSKDRDRKPLIKPSSSSLLSSSLHLPLSNLSSPLTKTPDRKSLIKPSPSFLSSSLQLPLSNLSSPLTKTPDRKCLLLPSPRCSSPLPRFDSPKSTAALYKCLESLLEDSKHFFKRLSPARTRRLPHLMEKSIAEGAAAPKQLLPAAMEHTLPVINTCRSEAMSPRDSGCVKRASDRLKRHFYFAEEDGTCQPGEAALPASGIMST